jgi:hypothetical protein
MYKITVHYSLKNPYKPNGYGARLKVELPVADEPDEILLIYRADRTFLGNHLSQNWGDPSADRRYRYRHVVLSADNWTELQEQIDAEIVGIEMMLYNVVHANRKAMFEEIPPKLELLIDPLVDPINPFNQSQAAEAASESPTRAATDAIDTTTCCSSRRLSIWRNALQPGDYIKIWSDDIGDFSTYRIHQIERRASSLTSYFIKFNPLSGIVDKVTIDLIFPPNKLS